MRVPVWTVTLKDSVIDDLRSLGRTEGRALLKAAVARLAAGPLAETRHMKTLRPNPVAHRELRLLGKYRVLYVVERTRRRVTIVLVGEKRGETLLVQGRRFTAHHESHPPE
jgi:mRNA-degrading endonuclease RelE of RelBE toxin-antitoxin system